MGELPDLLRHCTCWAPSVQLLAPVCSCWCPSVQLLRRSSEGMHPNQRASPARRLTRPGSGVAHTTAPLSSTEVSASCTFFRSRSYAVATRARVAASCAAAVGTATWMQQWGVVGETRRAGEQAGRDMELHKHPVDQKPERTLSMCEHLQGTAHRANGSQHGLVPPGR